MAIATKEEKAWIKKINKLLANPPSDRLGFYTMGDPNVEIFDISRDSEIDDGLSSGKYGDFCIGVSELNAELGTLYFPSGVYSTSG